MCVVSMVLDHYNNEWNRRGYIYGPTTINPFDSLESEGWSKIVEEAKRSQEIEQLKNEVAELKKWVKEAKEYDKRTNQPNCESQEKLQLLKAIAKALNIDITDLSV